MNQEDLKCGALDQNAPDMRFWQEKIRQLTPYVPGEQPKHADLCKLNTNENPFPPSPKVAQAIGAILQNGGEDLRLYPDPESEDLCQILAKTYGIRRDQVFVGNGSDEVLAHVFACFFGDQKPVLTPEIGYSFYPVYAQTFDVWLKKVPLEADFSLNLSAFDQECGGIIFANPNAPTGILLAHDQVESLLQRHQNALVVVDEAYIDFAGEGASAVSLIDKYDNLLVVQTFSKSRSLAGLRVGMAFANANLIEALNRYKNSFNSYPMDRLAQAGAIASLQDVDYFVQTCRQVQTLREHLTADLRALGFFVPDSCANFVFAKPPSHLGSAKDLASALRSQGVIVRHFQQDKIDEFLRITVGTAEQNQRLISSLNALR